MPLIDLAVENAAPNYNLQLAQQHALKRDISRAAWGWFELNQNLIVVSRKILFFRLDVRVRDLEPVFEWLFGRREIREDSR